MRKIDNSDHSMKKVDNHDHNMMKIDNHDHNKKKIDNENHKMMNDSNYPMKVLHLSLLDSFRDVSDNHQNNDRNHIRIYAEIDYSNDQMNHSLNNHGDKMLNEGLEKQLSFFPMYWICKEMKHGDIHPNKKYDNHDDH